MRTACKVWLLVALIAVMAVAGLFLFGLKVWAFVQMYGCLCAGLAARLFKGEDEKK